ncbi:MAG: DUF3667 domain-containing protein [Flavisolibacter sp.]
MSHQPERKEKNCLNCGATVAGYYCQDCGQPNIILKQNFWSLVKHFIYDILHFDGKFFHTLRDIFFRPGFVARQYVEGKRARYLDPIRMYLFTSAVFFLVFFSLSSSDVVLKPIPLTMEERQEWKQKLRKSLALNPSDSTIRYKLGLLDSVQQPVYTSDITNATVVNFFNNKIYRSVAEYDSIQAALPEKQKDNWFERKITKRSIAINTRFKGMEKQGKQYMWNYVMHKLPYLLFFSLPFFALILRLVYVRRKQLYYSDHAIFTLYHYILSFLLLLLLFGFNKLEDETGWSVFNFLIIAVIFGWYIYFILELKYFYRQGWGKTILKFFIIGILGVVLMILLLAIFFFFSIFQI